MVKGNGPYAYEEEKVKTADGWRTRHVRYLGKTTPGMPVQTGRPAEIPEQRPIIDEPGPTEIDEKVEDIGKMPSDVGEELDKEDEPKWGWEKFKDEAEEVTGKMPRDLDEEEEESPSSGIEDIGRMPKDVSKDLEEETKWGIDEFKEMAEEGYTPGGGVDEEEPEPEPEPEPEEVEEIGGSQAVRGLMSRAKEGVGEKMPTEIPSLELRENIRRGRIAIKDRQARKLIEQTAEGERIPDEEPEMEVRMPSPSEQEAEEDREDTSEQEEEESVDVDRPGEY